MVDISLGSCASGICGSSTVDARSLLVPLRTRPNRATSQSQSTPPPQIRRRTAVRGARGVSPPLFWAPDPRAGYSLASRTTPGSTRTTCPVSSRYQGTVRTPETIAGAMLTRACVRTLSTCVPRSRRADAGSQAEAPRTAASFCLMWRLGRDIVRHKACVASSCTGRRARSGRSIGRRICWQRVRTMVR